MNERRDGRLAPGLSESDPGIAAVGSSALADREGRNAVTPLPPEAIRHVIALIHGIMTDGFWRLTVAPLLESPGVHVRAISYGRLSVLRFLVPALRRPAIAQVRAELYELRDRFPHADLSIVAHSFGTFIVATLLQERRGFRLRHLILCGSVLPHKHDWTRIATQVKGGESTGKTGESDTVVNDVGVRDIWPEAARLVSFSYGNSGTRGFGTAAPVLDRFHDLGHSGFFRESGFVERYWKPVLDGGTVAKPDSSVAARTPRHIRLLRSFPAATVIWGTLLLSGAGVVRGVGDRISSFPGINSSAIDLTACAQIVSTNDEHGQLAPTIQGWSQGRPVGGAAALASYVEEVRVSDPDCPVFVVSAGDMMQGTLVSNETQGKAMIVAMDLIGYDAAAIGNHEFDWGVDVLVERVEQATFAMLGANIFLKGSDRHPAWVRPWSVVEKAGVRVGFVGVTTPSTPATTRDLPELEFRPIVEALERYIPIVREQGVDFVVVVMHEGAFCDAQSVCVGAALDALEATKAPFDYAVTGHTHSGVVTEVRGVPVVQSFANWTAFAHGRLERDSRGAVQSTLIGTRRTYADSISADRTVNAVLELVNQLADVSLDRVITRLERPLSRASRGGFPLGRLIADAQRFETGAEIALVNNGGIRRPLAAGDVTYLDLFELQPFGNVLYRVTISGARLLEALQQAVGDDGPDLQISGLTIHYDPNASAGARVLEVFADDGSVVRADRLYNVAVNDFIASGGGGYTMFRDADATQTSLVDLEALVRYLERQPQPVRAPGDPRWIEARSR